MRRGARLGAGESPEARPGFGLIRFDEFFRFHRRRRRTSSAGLSLDPFQPALVVANAFPDIGELGLEAQLVTRS